MTTLTSTPLSPTHGVSSASPLVWPQPAPTHAPPEHGSSGAQAAAYVRLGWAVAPGPLSNGLTYRDVYRQPADCRHPVGPVFTDPGQAARWWRLGGTLLSQVGHPWEVLRLPVSVACTATAQLHRLGPIALLPDGAHLWLPARTRLAPALAVSGGQLLEPGSWIPLPPSTTPGGRACWWTHPHPDRGPTDPDDLAAALTITGALR